MFDGLNNFMQQFQALSPGRRMALVATAAGSLAFFLWITGVGSKAEYRLLYRGLDDSEAAQVVDALTAERIEYRLEEGGSAILVPGAMVHEARIRVAGKGLPSGGSRGFEIFDKTGFGVTDFVQKVNYRRALQGELARSVEQLESVEKARVQIAIPERTVFLRRKGRGPSASVVVRMRAGTDLAGEQVRGIVHLVASSVEGLEPNRVTLVDNRGRLLSPSGSGPAGPEAPAAAMGQQARVERDLERQVESILERVVGIGHVAVRVRADLDWTQLETTEERYDPDSQVARSEQRTTETSNDVDSQQGGPAGIVANSPGIATSGTATGSRSNSTRTDETINYELSKTVSRRIAPVGSIRRLSVAVLVDGQRVAPAAAGEEAEESFKAWDAESLSQFEVLAKRAVGFDSERGDELSVINAPFPGIELVDEEGNWLEPQVMVLVTTVLRWLLLLVALLIFARLMVRPLAEVLRVDEGRVLGVRAGDLAAQLEGAEGEALAPGDLEEASQPATLPDQVNALAARRGDDSVKTIRGWLGA